MYQIAEVYRKKPYCVVAQYKILDFRCFFGKSKGLILKIFHFLLYRIRNEAYCILYFM
jgi:hypothetical protein